MECQSLVWKRSLGEGQSRAKAAVKKNLSGGEMVTQSRLHCVAQQYRHLPPWTTDQLAIQTSNRIDPHADRSSC